MYMLNQQLKNDTIFSIAIRHGSQEQGVEIRLVLLSITPSVPFAECGPLASHTGAFLLMTKARDTVGTYLVSTYALGSIGELLFVRKNFDQWGLTNEKTFPLRCISFCSSEASWNWTTFLSHSDSNLITLPCVDFPFSFASVGLSLTPALRINSPQ